MTYSNLFINKHNSNKTKLDISIKKINYNLLKNKKINYITLYDDNLSNEEVYKPHSKPVSPRIMEKTTICFSKEKEKKDKDNSNDNNSLKKNLSSQIIITNHFNFYQNIITSKKDNKLDKENNSKINNQRINNQISLKGYNANTSTNHEIFQHNNLKNNFLQSTSNSYLLKNKFKNKVNNNNNNSSILFKNSHSKSSSVFISPDSNHHSVNTSLSHLQMNMKGNKKESYTANPSAQNSRKNSKEKIQSKNQNQELYSNKLIKSYEDKGIPRDNFAKQYLNSNNTKLQNCNNTTSKISVNKNISYVNNKDMKKKLKTSYVDNGNNNQISNSNTYHSNNINNKNNNKFSPQNISEFTNVKSLLNNKSNLLKFKHNFIYSNNGSYIINGKIKVKNNNISTKNTSLSNKSIKKKEENEKDYLKFKLDNKQIHKSSITTVPSKHNSKSTSRVEEQQSIITMNSKEKVIKLCKDKIFAKTPAYSPENSFKSKIINDRQNYKQCLIKCDKTNHMNYKKKTIQKLTKKKKKDNKENNGNVFKPSHDDRINTDNILVAENILYEEDMKRLETENMTIEKILSEDNTYQMINTLSSIQSTTKDNLFYRKERDKIANYIQNYYETEHNYPTSKLEFYKFGRIIGKGAFGKVNLALHICSGQLVAIKSFDKKNLKNPKARKKIDQEIAIMKRIHNQFITQILDYFETDTHLFIVMEYICEDLLNYISKRSQIPEVTSKFIFKQLIEGLQYLHSQSIIHRDIKLDNILIDLSNTVKICDFGVSRIVKPNDIMYDHCGTPAYIAPEIFLNKGYKGFACDIWSAGVTLHYMLSGNQPFKGSDISKLQTNILEEKLGPIEGISEEANHLIQRMLVRNPKNRITIEEILYHPWLVGVKSNLRDDCKYFYS